MTNDNVQRFINVWKKEFGEELTPEEGRAELNRLLVFFTRLASMEAVPPAVKETGEKAGYDHRDLGTSGTLNEMPRRHST